jgi:DNA topoisomerase-1
MASEEDPGEEGATAAKPARKARKRAGALVVVESPAKAKTLQRLLGAGYAVRASHGHVRDLPEATLGVDPSKGFAPQWVQVKGQAKVVSELKRAAREAERVFLATDPDREGEAIAWHLADEIARPGDPRIRRVLLHELTPAAVKEALLGARDLDRRVSDAQQARRVLDRLVGFQVSEVLWQKVRRGLSAGRVQSVAVRLVVDREREIEAFRPVESWALDARLLARGKKELVARLEAVDGEAARVGDGATAAAYAEELRGATFTVGEVARSERRREAPPPFTTAGLQQEAARVLGFSPRKTMSLAQKLYEGVELGDDGLVGLISYMRTDSVHVTPAVVEAIRGHVAGTFGEDHLPAAPNTFTARRGAQLAHEAIRPTAVERTPETLKPLLAGAGGRDLLRLYGLVWMRAVESQMAAAVYEDTRAVVEAGRFRCVAAGTALRHAGWLAVQDEDAAAAGLPKLEAGQALTLVELEPRRELSAPPPRFGEASLVHELDERGLARPSTYASILETIQERGYVERERRELRPTELGKLVTGFLVERFPRMMDPGFTAEVEASLDAVEEGRTGYEEVVRAFHAPFAAELAAAREAERPAPSDTGIRCPRCGKPMVVKAGRTGEFLSCSGYPSCRGTRSFRRGPQGELQLEEEVRVEELCPECGGAMAMKGGRSGRFLGCVRYPACRGTRPYVIGIPCPKGCGGGVTERRSKLGRTFFGCSGYPKCDFVSWDRPRDEACPECGSAWMVERVSRTGLPVVACPNKECGFQRPAGAPRS